jgi:hypothetical protein
MRASAISLQRGALCAYRSNHRTFKPPLQRPVRLYGWLFFRLRRTYAQVKNPHEAYSGRRFDCRVINTTIDEEAVQILYQLCPPGRKGTGKFLSRLIYEHAARVDERQRLRQIVQDACMKE